MLPCERNNSSAMRCQWVNIICFFFQFLSLSWAKSTMCTHALCLLLCVVLISRRSFIKIYRMESWQWMYTMWMCVYLLTYKQKMHTVNLPIFAVAGVALTGYSHSLWYNEMALKLMHRGGERCTLIYLKYGAMKQRQPSDNNALGLGE